jgi:Fe-Mn family superoxide dismutase
MIELMQLPYNFDALEPHIDALTMQIHHDKHHQAYLDNYNKIAEKYPERKDKTIETVLTEINNLQLEATDKQGIINHGGGVVNHNMFWQIMDPKNSPDQELINQINTTFGSIEVFKAKFAEAATKRFGSGWAWLAKNNEGKLEIYNLPNQDSPLSLGHTPLLCLDVWEHAYYLKYQNKRADYINAWWNTIKLLS